MISRIRAEWRFDKQQGYTFGVKLHNATWLALEPFLPRATHRRVMSALR